MVKIASPLFIVRNEAETDLFGVLEKLAAVGFQGVEFLGFFGLTPRAIRQKLDSISLKAMGNHVDLDAFAADPERVIEDHLTLGCEYITLSLPERAHDPETDGFAECLLNLPSAAEKCVKSGITPLFHNHQFEFERDLRTLPGRPYGDEQYMLDVILNAVPAFAFEPDIGWMLYAGADPAQYLARYHSRCPVIHLKDVYIGGAARDAGVKGEAIFRPTGYGSVAWERIFPLALECDPQWFVIDHDCAYDRDAYQDLAWSLAFTQNMLNILETPL